MLVAALLASLAAQAGHTMIAEPTVKLVANTAIPAPLPAEDTLTAVRARNTVMRICYEMAVEDSPTLAGQVRIQVHWAAAGNPLRLKLMWNSLANPDTASCVTEAASKIKFPPGDLERADPYFATFTWLFEPGTAQDAPDIAGLVEPCFASVEGQGIIGLTTKQDAEGKVTAIEHTQDSGSGLGLLTCLTQKLDGAALTATGNEQAWRYAWAYGE